MSSRGFWSLLLPPKKELLAEVMKGSNRVLRRRAGLARIMVKAKPRYLLALVGGEALVWEVEVEDVQVV